MAFTGWIQLSDGRLVSYALAPDAFEEDCRRASVVVATRDAPGQLRRQRDRAKPVARSRGAGAAPRRLGLRDRVNACGEFRPALGAAAIANERYRYA